MSIPDPRAETAEAVLGRARLIARHLGPGDAAYLAELADRYEIAVATIVDGSNRQDAEQATDGFEEPLTIELALPVAHAALIGAGVEPGLTLNYKEAAEGARGHLTATFRALGDHPLPQAVVAGLVATAAALGLNLDEVLP